MPIHFTDLSIRSLREGVYFDDRTPSFGIRVGKNRRTWLVLKGDNRTKVRLGHYPALGLAEARRKALIALGSPFEPADAPTFPEARQEFLAQDRWKESSQYEIARNLNRYFSWTKTLDKITHQDVAKAIDAIGAKSQAAHALKDLKTFFNWCVPRYISNSPCRGLKVATRYVPRDRVLTDDELARVWKAAGLMGGYGKQVQLLIATGQRANQIISLRPEWISGGLINFPASVMKSNRAHSIPLGKLAISLIGGDRPATYQGARKKELDCLSGVENYVLHDFRRVFASGLASLGVSLPTIERLLAHQSGSFAGIVGVYQKYDWMPEMKKAIDLWERHLRSLCVG